MALIERRSAKLRLVSCMAAALLGSLVWAALPALAQVPFGAPARFVAGSAPSSLAVGDFNGDSDLDLAVANSTSDDVSILLGGSGGTFLPAGSVAAGDGPSSVIAGVFNGDSSLDLAVANSGSDNVSVLLGGGNGSFGAATSFAAGDGPSSVDHGDVDGDGDSDLVVGNFSSDNVSVLLGSGSGSFGAATSVAAGDGPSSLVIGDFNQEVDSNSDVVVANSGSDNVSVLLGTGNGSFGPATTFAAGDGPSSVAVGDYNQNFDPDLAIANSASDNVSVLLGGDGGSFLAPTNFAVGDGPNSLVVADLNDTDRDLDLAIANRVSDSFSVLLGGSGGSFGAVADYAVGRGPSSVAAGDFDGDGQVDLAVANSSSNDVSVRLNRTGLVDTRPPETTITAGPGGLTSERSPSFEFSSTEPGSSFRCAVDSGIFVVCASPFATAPLADSPHVFAVQAIDPAGNADPTPARRNFTVQSSIPGPVLGQTVKTEPLAGEVQVSLPPTTTTAALAASVPGLKGRRFVPLRKARLIPVGSILDTRGGEVRLTSARNRRGATQSGVFVAGVFQVLQSRSTRAGGLTELRLKGASSASCRRAPKRKASAAARRRLSRRTIRRLRANAKGRFRTRGRYSAATVRGTRWVTEDRCDGTLTSVARGNVVVRDFRRRRSIIVRAGKRYLARAGSR